VSAAAANFSFYASQKLGENVEEPAVFILYQFPYLGIQVCAFSLWNFSREVSIEFPSFRSCCEAVSQRRRCLAVIATMNTRLGRRKARTSSPLKLAKLVVDGAIIKQKVRIIFEKRVPSVSESEVSD
jgi:hypothetical protein